MTQQKNPETKEERIARARQLIAGFRAQPAVIDEAHARRVRVQLMRARAQTKRPWDEPSWLTTTAARKAHSARWRLR